MCLETDLKELVKTPPWEKKLGRCCGERERGKMFADVNKFKKEGGRGGGKKEEV